MLSYKNENKNKEKSQIGIKLAMQITFSDWM